MVKEENKLKKYEKKEKENQNLISFTNDNTYGKVKKRSKQKNLLII